MAKLHEDLPSSNATIRLKLTAADGSNAFVGTEALCDNITGSATLRQFLAGLVKYLDQVFNYVA
jgi:hypothetical protein